MIFAVVIAGIALFVMYRVESNLKALKAEQEKKDQEAIVELIKSLEVSDDNENHSQDEKDLSIDPVIRAARQRVHCPTQPPYRNGLHDWTYRNDNKMQCCKCGMMAGDAVSSNGNY